MDENMEFYVNKEIKSDDDEILVELSDLKVSGLVPKDQVEVFSQNLTLQQIELIKSNQLKRYEVNSNQFQNLKSLFLLKKKSL